MMEKLRYSDRMNHTLIQECIEVKEKKQTKFNSTSINRKVNNNNNSLGFDHSFHSVPFHGRRNSFISFICQSVS